MLMMKIRGVTKCDTLGGSQEVTVINESGMYALIFGSKGYAKAVAKRGRKWLDKHYDEFDQIVWWTRKENIASIKLAEDNGFTLDESSVLLNDPWIKYQYKR